MTGVGWVVLATGLVGSGGWIWVLLGWFWVWLWVSGLVVIWVVSGYTGVVGVLGGGFLGFGWLFSCGGWVVWWFWPGLGVGDGWFLGLGGLSLVKNGSIGLVVGSLSLTGLLFIGLGLVPVIFGCVGFWFVTGCTFRSEHGLWFELLVKIPVKFNCFLSISISTFMSG